MCWMMWRTPCGRPWVQVLGCDTTVEAADLRCVLTKTLGFFTDPLRSRAWLKWCHFHRDLVTSEKVGTDAHCTGAARRVHLVLT
jgi:hypothetical protein